MIGPPWIHSSTGCLPAFFGRVIQLWIGAPSVDFVVMLSPFQAGAEYADVILPVGPFTETAGTFVNCEGRVQTFQNSASTCDV